MSLWVTNASPLIFLAKLDRLPLLRSAASKIFVPTTVIEEIAAQKDSAFERVDAALRSWLDRREPIVGERIHLLGLEVGLGEAAAIALGIEARADRIVLDDLDARRWAQRLGLRPIGTLGILLAARLRGELPSLEAEIDRLTEAGFRIGDALMNAVLKEAGER